MSHQHTTNWSFSPLPSPPLLSIFSLYPSHLLAVFLYCLCQFSISLKCNNPQLYCLACWANVAMAMWGRHQQWFTFKKPESSYKLILCCHEVCHEQQAATRSTHSCQVNAPIAGAWLVFNSPADSRYDPSRPEGGVAQHSMWWCLRIHLGLVWEVCRNNSWFTHRGKTKTKLNPHKHKRTIPEPKRGRRGAVKQTQWRQEQQRLTGGLWGQKLDFTHGLFSKRHGAIISGRPTGL